MEQKFCESARDPKFSNTEMCVLFGLRQHTFLNVSTKDTLSIITRLYDSPANLPIRWNHAVAISEALASGVAVTEPDLQVIRRGDAKRNLTE
jgi:hypothetical protein